MRLAAFLFAVLLCGPAFAQTLRIVVPFPPGGGADVLARLLAPKLAETRAQKLSADANRALADSDLRSRMRALGADVSASSPDEFALYIRDDMAKRARLMGEIGSE